MSDPWPAIAAAGSQSEQEAVRSGLAEAPFTVAERQRVLIRARDLVEGCRGRGDERSLLDLFLQEYGLSNEEGIALLCISEALLRIPDDDTAEALIAEKIGTGNWAEHVGLSDSVFLNASTWALMLTGNVIGLGDDVTRDIGGWVNRLAARVGESVARAAMSRAVRIVGGEFVQGRTIEEALVRERSGGTGLSSFDMLGEGARTYEDAARYAEAYRHAIRAVGEAYRDATPTGASGISIKLSALHPRFEPLQRERVMRELGPAVLDLAREAAARNIHMTIDAEEAERLELLLEVFELLAKAPELASWEGLGIAIQAYAKRAPAVIDWLDALHRPVMVRLV
ncbi:MAG: proline dehydrogenase family protein, partial [Pseudomonadales bacterium]|nr:proline dehydrogenase family protein [Pseudomonadales bacterium]